MFVNSRIGSPGIVRAVAAFTATLLVMGLAAPGGRNAWAQVATPTSPPTSPLAGWRYETWFQFRNNSESSDGSQQGTATLRLYQPFELGQGWRLTMREDIFGINTNQEGQDNRDQQWRSNI